MRLPGKDEGDIGNTLRDWWITQYPYRPKEKISGEGFAKIPNEEIPKMIEQILTNAKENLDNQLGELERLIRERAAEASIEVYESQVPTTFLALLAERKHEKAQGVLLAYPYNMFRVKHRAFGMLLKSTGDESEKELYAYFAGSIKRFFEDGLKLGHLRSIPLRVLRKKDVTAR